jgi:hypothetical protein
VSLCGVVADLICWFHDSTCAEICPRLSEANVVEPYCEDPGEPRLSLHVFMQKVEDHAVGLSVPIDHMPSFQGHVYKQGVYQGHWTQKCI